MRVFNLELSTALVLSSMLTAPAAFASVASEDCAMCHGGDDEDVVAVGVSSLEGSIHEGFDCTDCHVTVEDLPHDDDLPPAACGECHDDEASAFTRHGRGTVGETPDIPTCGSCHGTHDILPVDDPRSPVHVSSLGATCDRCHGNVDLIREHDIRFKEPIDVFEASVHGQAADSMGAATCIDCHGAGGSAHVILAPGNPLSSINHFNIPATCGTCHTEIAAAYMEGIHGELVARGETESPVCTQCHGEHGILPVDDPRSRVSPALVAQATCAPCHESAMLNERYGLAAGKLRSFSDSFHGLKSKNGDASVANCASCHGSHRILPSADPRSQINPANLRETCGHCHPGISTMLAQTRIHQQTVAPARGYAHWFAFAYTILIVLVIGGMGLYVVVDFGKHVRDRRRGGVQVQRMDLNARVQHALLLTSFMVLVLTGFALRYSDLWLFRTLFAWDGGFSARGDIHRVAASVFVVLCVYHLVFLFGPRGRRFARDMRLSITDGHDFRQMVEYNLDRRHLRPRIGRFGFVEKAEYWALVWGSVIMTVTGFALWFDNWAVSMLSPAWMDVLHVIHFYEAVLATLAILVWHFYAVIFSPAVYPGSPAFLTGKMPRQMLEHEHPEDPVLEDAVGGDASSVDPP